MKAASSNSQAARAHHRHRWNESGHGIGNDVQVSPIGSQQYGIEVLVAMSGPQGPGIEVHVARFGPQVYGIEVLVALFGPPHQDIEVVVSGLSQIQGAPWPCWFWHEPAGLRCTCVEQLLRSEGSAFASKVKGFCFSLCPGRGLLSQMFWL